MRGSYFPWTPPEHLTPHLVFSILLTAATVTTHDTQHTTHNTRQSHHTTVTAHDIHSTTVTSHDSHCTTVISYDSHSTTSQHTTAQHTTSQHTTVTHTTAQRTTVTSHTLWHYTGRHLSTPYGVARKLLTGACLAKTRLDFWLWFEFKAMLAALGCTRKHLCRRSGTTLADI